MNYNSIIEKLREEIKEVMEKERICGLAIALVDNDKIVWSEGFGFTDNTKKEKVTADTLFSTQSMGKTITATTFMILASKGLINLDDPIRKYYPEFTINTKFGEREQEVKNITFRRMLTHTAGFTHEAWVGNNYNNTPCTFEEHIASINGIWLRSKVGSELAYANLGIDLTGYVLGRIMKKTFPEVVKEELFQPLGIKTATLDINEAKKYSYAKGNIGDFETPTVQVPMLGAGGVYISVNEQAKLTMLHLNKGKIKGKELISKENFQEMYKQQFEDEGVKANYGLGLYKDGPIGDAEVYSHDGGGYGYLTAHSWIPKYKIAAIVFTNSMHHNGKQGRLVRKALELMMKEKTKPKIVNVAPESLKKFVGTYFQHRVSMQNIVFENGMLIVYDLFGNKQILYPQSEFEFQTEDKEILTFILDEQQKVKTLKWKTQNALFKIKYNDGPNDKKGPNKKSWGKYLGMYEFESYGVKYYLALGTFNGYLYLYQHDKRKLEEYQDKLYFTSDGEAFVLDEKKMNFRNIPLTKIDLNTDELLAECKTNKQQRQCYIWSFDYLAAVLYWLEGFQKAYEFILKTIEIDDAFKDNLRGFGTRIYAFRELDNAKTCFEKLLSLDKNDKKAKEMIDVIAKEKFSLL